MNLDVLWRSEKLLVVLKTFQLAVWEYWRMCAELSTISMEMITN